jgi:histidinol-phosphate aminotransferase
VSTETSVGGYSRPVSQREAVRLDLNEAPHEAGEVFRHRLLELLAACQWRRYPDMDGASTRVAAAKLYGWHEEGTLVGNGSNDLLAAALRALLPRGGSLLALSPSFSMYPVLAERQGARLLEVPLRPPEFRAERQVLMEGARAADVILLCSPNNPTGGELEEDVWDEVLGLGKPVLWDAAYGEFAAVKATSWLERFANLGVLRSLSKAWGLAGLRAGALLGTRDFVAKVGEQILPFQTGWLVQSAYEAASELGVEGETLVRETVVERERQIEALRALPGVLVPPSSGNFFLLRVGERGGASLAAALLERGVAVREIPALAESGYVRITVGSPSEGDLLLKAAGEVANG